MVVEYFPKQKNTKPVYVSINKDFNTTNYTHLNIYNLQQYHQPVAMK